MLAPLAVTMRYRGRDSISMKVVGSRQCSLFGGVTDSEATLGNLLGCDNILYLDLGGGFMGV